MKKILKNITSSAYYRNALTLISGSAIAQIILMASTLVLARMYSPEEFGIYTNFLAVIQVLGIIASGCYQFAIMLPKNNNTALEVFFLSIIITIIFVFCSWGAIFLFPSSVLTWITTKMPIWVLYLIPLGTLLFAIVSATNYIGNRTKCYSAISTSKISNSFTISSVSLALGWWEYTAIGLLVGKFLGWIVEITTLSIPIYRRLKPHIHFPSYTKLIALAKKYDNFPKYAVPGGLLNSGSRQIPVFALTALFTPDIVGFYGMAAMAIQKPMYTITSAFSQVFFQKASTLANEEKDIRQLFINNLKFLFALAVIPSSIAFIFAPSLLSWLLGEDWYTTGIYARWLLPFAFVSFLKTPFSSLVDIRNKISQNIWFEVIFTLLALGAFYGAYLYHSPLLGIQLFSLSCGLLGLVQLYWFYLLAQKNTGW